MLTGWLLGLTMQIADFGALKDDLVQQQQQQQQEQQQEQLEQDSTNLTNLFQLKTSVEPVAVQTDVWTTGQTRHSVLIPDQSVQSNVVMIILLVISIVIYSLMRRPSLSSSS